ncbi:MAG: hypothetical protein ABI645_17005, partial [Pseudomonadota bacterium]
QGRRIRGMKVYQHYDPIRVTAPVFLWGAAAALGVVLFGWSLLAGWTDPQVKKDLGAEFTWTEHAVYVRNPVLRWILRLFRRHFEGDATWDSK